MPEAAETQTWLEFYLSCDYISEDFFNKLDREYENIIGMLNAMDFKADKFCF
jgi:four helix bundle protein